MAIEAKRLLERANAKLLGIIFNNVYRKERYHYSYHYGAKYSAAITPVRSLEDTADHDVATPTIEMHQTAVPQQWMGAVETPPVASDPMPIVIGREDHSHGLYITLHAVTLRRHIGSQHTAAGTVFLIADVEITNDGAFGHLFDPTLTALTARAETDYGRALASFIPIHGAEDDAAMLQTERGLGHYDAALTAHIGGLETVVEIAADLTSRGNLVYHIPAASALYTFMYTNSPIAVNIPFTLPASS